MMHLRRAFIGSILFSIVVCSVFSRGSDENEANPSGEDGVWVVDHLGREVLLPSEPQRILALNPLVMEGLFAIGIAPIGKVESYRIRQEGIDLPSVGGNSVNLEKIQELAPDLILAHKKNQGQIIEALEAVCPSVYVFDPAQFGENPMLSVYSFLGELLDRPEEAEAYIESVNAVANELNGRIRANTDLESGAILQIQGTETVAVAQNATFYGSLINALGLRNIVPEDLIGSATMAFIKYDVETLIVQDPDFIFILAQQKDDAANAQILEAFVSDPKWSELSSVEAGNVKILPFAVNPGRSTPEQALRITARAVLGE
jgi:iron complex transport system substrate-binding protein